MEYDITRLKRFSSYAKQIDKTITWVNTLAVNGKIKVVKVDGMKFVLVD